MAGASVYTAHRTARVAPVGYVRVYQGVYMGVYTGCAVKGSLIR